jgi:hypothetical protein
MQTNAGCRLPCWWGVEPGKTTWDDALEMLSPFASKILTLPLANDEMNAALVFTNVPGEDNPLSPSGLRFRVQNGVIQNIQVEGFYKASNSYYVAILLANYGEPGDVWMDATNPSGTDSGERSTAIQLFYPTLGVFAQYDSIGDLKGEAIHACYDKGPYLFLWNPEHILTIDDVYRSIEFMAEFSYLPVSKALGMDTHSFYLTYQGSDSTTCLDTPRELWRWWDDSPGIATPTP